MNAAEEHKIGQEDVYHHVSYSLILIADPRKYLLTLRGIDINFHVRSFSLFSGVTLTEVDSIAGFETTATSIAYAVWELARYPDKQRRLREELSALPGDPSSKDMQERLPYLDAILKET